MKSGFYLLALAGMVFITSCDKDDPIITNDETCVLLESIWDAPNDPSKGITEYNYNSAGQLIEIAKADYDLDPTPYNERWTLTYDGNQVSRVNHYTQFRTDPEDEHEITYFFYENDLVDSISVDANRPPITGTYTYKDESYMLLEYSGDKVVKLTTYLTLTVDNSIVEDVTTLDWTGNNVTKITRLLGGELVSTIYTYDDKKRPYRNFTMAFAQTQSLFNLSENNVLSNRYTYAGIMRGSDFTYEYNSDDYPISSSYTDLANGWTPPPIVYTYDCK